jgi:hypothetical protein
VTALLFLDTLSSPAGRKYTRYNLRAHVAEIRLGRTRKALKKEEEREEKEEK